MWKREGVDGPGGTQFSLEIEKSPTFNILRKNRKIPYFVLYFSGTFKKSSADSNLLYYCTGIPYFIKVYGISVLFGEFHAIVAITQVF